MKDVNLVFILVFSLTNNCARVVRHVNLLTVVQVASTINMKLGVLVQSTKQISSSSHQDGLLVYAQQRSHKYKFYSLCFDQTQDWVSNHNRGKHLDHNTTYSICAPLLHANARNENQMQRSTCFEYLLLQLIPQ